MLKTLKNNRGFTLAEVLVAIAIFAISTCTLTYSFINGLLCKNQIYDSKNNASEFSSLISQIIKTSPSKSDLEKIHTLNLPTKRKAYVTFKVKQTKNDYLYCVKVMVDEKPFTKLYVVNKFWATP